MKYLIRADNKGGLEDLEKARVYLSWEIDGRNPNECKTKTYEEK